MCEGHELEKQKIKFRVKGGKSRTCFHTTVACWEETCPHPLFWRNPHLLLPPIKWTVFF
jgi:hypothetical protein